MDFANELDIPVAVDELTLPRFLARVSARGGHHPALVTVNARCTYAELGERVDATAKGLIASGVEAGSRAALLLGNRVEFVVAYFAAASVGAVVVPLNTYAPAEELDALLTRSDARWLITQDELAGRRFVRELRTLPAWAQITEVISVDDAVPGTTPWRDVLSRGDDVDDSDVYRRAAAVQPGDDALVVWTSGTTERPKGVVHRHQAAVIQSWRWADQLRLGSEDRVYTAYPMFWTAGLATALGGALAGGSTLVFQEVVEPQSAVDLIERERVTTLLVPLHIDIEAAEYAQRAGRDVSSIRRVRRGSKLGELAGIDGDDWDPGGGYGLTEMFTIVTHLPADAPLAMRRGTHGRALPGTEVRIVDPETGEALPAGAVGEIAVRGITLMRGYVGEDPIATFDADGFYHSQDCGSLDDAGYLHWAGRVSGMIKTKGANVSPVEVERAVTDWGGVKMAKAVGVAHPVVGEAVVLCAVRRDDSITEADVREALRAVLAPYKVPARVLFFAESELELTGSQKLRQDQLRALAQRRIAAAVGDDPAWSEFLEEAVT